MAKVYSQKGRLYLHASLPRKDGGPGSAQYKITLKLDDTPTNRRLAEQQLKKVKKDLHQGCFDWAEWTDDGNRAPRWRDGIQALYRKKVTLGRLSESTWARSHMGHLKQLDPNAVITVKALEEAVTKYDRTQSSYKFMYYLIRDIADLTGMPFPELGCPLYGEREKELVVPSDQEIIDWVLKAPQPQRYYFGMMATYGARPHEIDRAVLLDGDELQIPDNTKTGQRIVIPLLPAWVDLFRLRKQQKRPPSNRYEPLPDECAQWMNRKRHELGIKWNSYSLRHAFAGRLWKMGGGQLDIYTAARLMGHSVKEHEKTYRRWIQPFSIAMTARDAINRNMADVEGKVLKQLEWNQEEQQKA